VKPAVLALAIALLAPLQCSRPPQEHPRYEDNPAEALFDLATRFGQEGDEAARRRTLEYLMERYPGSRFAEAARVALREPAP
jgi:TolA-binding protein